MNRLIVLVLFLLLAGSKIFALDGFERIEYRITSQGLTFDVGTYNGAHAAICTGVYGEQEIVNLTIPDEVIYEENPYPVIAIGESAFCGEPFRYKGLLSLPESVTIIEEYAFFSCHDLTGSLSIPESVTTIGAHAFDGCHGFTGSLFIPESVTTIGAHAFDECFGFDGSLKLPNSISEIEAYAFAGCSGLTGSLYIPESVKTIGAHAFAGCFRFTDSLIIPESVTTIGEGAFISCHGFNRLILPNSLKEIGKDVFFECSGFTDSLIIPESVTTIGSRAFEWCTGFSSLCLSNSVKTIGVYAFYGCSGFIGSLILPDSLIKIGKCAFSNCSGFNGSLDLPKSLTDIEDGVFEGCTGFTGSLTIPETVRIIGDYAFSQVKFNEIISLAVNPPSIYSGHGLNYSTPLYVPQQSIKVYKTTGIWENFKYIYPIGGLFPEQIIFNNDNLTLLLGQTEKLIVTIFPESVTDKTITWASDNEQIVSVSEDGIVTAVAVGVANITASCGDVSATCKVTVNPVTASTVTLNVSDMTLLVGQSGKLNATISPENVTDKTITWTSDNENIATVSEDGTVTAVAVGVANITASCGDVSATCKVMVNPVTATTITLNLSDMTLLVGQSDKLNATISPENVTDKTIIWTSDNENIATVSEDGTVTAVAVGVANITASCGDISATCKVTVIEIDRPETPKEFVKKGDGKSCTFVVMMNLSDSELTKEGYNFVYGYTDTHDTDHIIASSPLRYCHTTPEIFNNVNNDFWVYSYRYDANGDIVMSGRRHLDGNVDYDNDSVLLNEYLTRSFTSSDPDSWITPTSRGARIQIASSNSSLLTIHTLSGTLVYSDSFNSGKRVDMEISADRFVADVYVVTIQSGEIRTSKKIIIR